MAAAPFAFFFMVSLNRVMIVDQGSPDYLWARGVLLTHPDHPEIFVYPDTDQELNPKEMVGLEVCVLRIRPSSKPGPTKLTCNLAGPIFQDKFIDDSPLESSEELTKEQPHERPIKRSMQIEWSPSREAAVERNILRYQLKGRFARSKALAYLIDEAIERGLA